MKKIWILIIISLSFLVACTEHSITKGLNQVAGVNYTVAFNSNGGTTVSAITVEEGITIASPTSTKDGHTLEGWYKDKVLTNKWNFATDKVTGNTTLYAKWSTLKYALIQGGIFVMGNTTNISGDSDEVQHNVTLSSYYMGKTEVTFDEFDEYTRAKGLEQKSSTDLQGTEPVISVTWWDVIKYANWLSEKEGFPKAYNELTGDLLNEQGQVTTDTTKVKGYRLPTEAEWEYAARERGKDIVYAWGNGNPMVDGKPAANIADQTIWNGYTDGYSGSAPVGSFVVNELGLYDMAGNVLEWCNDWYGTYVDNETNPIGVASGTDRVVRGGSWECDSSLLRNARRNVNSPDISYPDLGFRLVRSY